MLPLKDTIRSQTFPVVTWMIIAANVAIFLYEFTLSPGQVNRLILNFGMIPARLHLNEPALLLQNPAPAITLFTHMFLHGGWFHILSNMWTLFIFGDNVEDRMGPGRYFLFYTLCGLAAGLTQALIAPTSRIPAVGASGAIAGVLGAYFILFPRARIVTLVPIFFFAWFIQLPAIVFLGFWFISQLFSGLMSLPSEGIMGGVAWWAHIGGFVFGMLLFRLFLKPRPPQTPPPPFFGDQDIRW
jgi:membrane associated rhomboid family serine protease